MNVPNSVKAAYSFDGYGTYLFENGTDPIEEGLKLDPNSEAYKNAERLSKRYGKRGRISADSYGLQGVLNDIERYNEWLYAQRMADTVGANFTTGPFNEDEAFANAKISGSDITVSDTADAPLTGLMRHETAHRVEALAPKEFSAYMSQLEGGSEAGYNTAVENARTAYRAATGRELPAELAHGEVAADLATNFLKDKNAIDRVRRLAENNPSVADRMYNAVKDLKARVQSLGGRTYRDDATGMSFSYIELRNAERLYEVAMAQAARNSRDAVSTGGTRYSFAGQNAQNANTSALDRAQQMEYDGAAKINIFDVEVVQSIGRKSVNEFTAEDIAKTEKFAGKYFRETGVKSPFFRAWFGDWRGNDTTEVEIINLHDKTKSMRGIVKNADTGFGISVSKIGIDHIRTHLHDSEFSKYIINNLKEITEKSVLLDSYVSENSGNTKHKNTMMMHSFYSPVIYDNEIRVVKLFVEEFYNDWNNEIQRRDYDLKEIEVLDDADRFGENNSAPLYASSKTSNIKISDLFKLVKTYDKNFSPNTASKVVNADGTPKVVYHGTPDGGFTDFDTYGGLSGHGLFGKGAYFTESREAANQHAEMWIGKNPMVYEVYLSIKKPIDMGMTADLSKWNKALADKGYHTRAERGNTNEDVLQKLKEELKYKKIPRLKGEEIARYILGDMGYDGITRMGGVSGGKRYREWVAFYPQQIKAKDNIGTYSSDTDNVFYSLRKGEPDKNPHEAKGADKKPVNPFIPNKKDKPKAHPNPLLEEKKAEQTTDDPDLIREALKQFQNKDISDVYFDPIRTDEIPKVLLEEMKRQQEENSNSFLEAIKAEQTTDDPDLIREALKQFQHKDFSDSFFEPIRTDEIPKVLLEEMKRQQEENSNRFLESTKAEQTTDDPDLIREALKQFQNKALSDAFFEPIRTDEIPNVLLESTKAEQTTYDTDLIREALKQFQNKDFSDAFFEPIRTDEIPNVLLEAMETEQQDDKKTVDKSGGSGIIDMDEGTETRERQRYGRNKSTLINHTYIDSGEYRRKFDKLTPNADVNRIVYSKAKEMLKHRSGTLYEDMYWIDGDTGNVVAREINSTSEQGVLYSNATQKAVKTYKNNNLIAIHNHPGSMPPSVADLNSCYRNGYNVGYVMCHNGKIFGYKSEENINVQLYDIYVKRFLNDGNSEFDAQLKALNRLKENHLIDVWEV